MKHGKVVRDRKPEIIRSEGRTAEVRVLEGDELLEALLSKPEEQTHELRTAPPRKRIEELADIVEVAQALARAFGIDMAALEFAAKAKRAERGGFSGGLWRVSQYR